MVNHWIFQNIQNRVNKGLSGSYHIHIYIYTYVYTLNKTEEFSKIFYNFLSYFIGELYREDMAQSILPLRVIAEPKLTHRERYLCEIDRSRNRALRYIRANTNPYNADYPTVEVINFFIKFLINSNLFLK